MQLIIRCNSCNEILTVDYSQITSLGNIEIRTAPCGCDREYVHCTADKCQEIADNIELRKELKKLKEDSNELKLLKDSAKNHKIVLPIYKESDCFGYYKNTLPCFECLSKSNCMEKSNETKS